MKKITSLFIALTAAWVGHAAENPPCTLLIDSQEAFDQWTAIDANGDGGDYQFTYSASGYALYKQNTAVQANDWLISPAISLTKGLNYKFTFTVENLSRWGSDKQDFDLCVGAEADPAAMTICQTYTNFYKSEGKAEKIATFTATESGDYHFALHLISQSYQGDFAVYGFSVSAVVPRPGAVTDLTIAAAEKGALQAELSWLWPTTSDLGGDAVDITGADIYRGTSTSNAAKIATIDVTDATAGSPASYIDATVPDNGKYYYKVIPFNADGVSEATAKAVQSPYIGMATSLNSLKNVTATAVEGSDKQIALTWDAPTAAEGYFDPSEVKYKINRSKDGATAETIESEWSGELPYIDTVDGLGSYVYTVYSIYNGSTAWSGQESNAVKTGGTASLPYYNDFETKNSVNLMTFVHGPECSKDWGWSSKKLSFWGGNVADAWAITPMFDLLAGKTYKITFSTWVAKSSSPKTLQVAIGTADQIDAFGEAVFEETISSQYAATKEVLFSVPADGIYCVGLHCIGKTDYNDIYVDDLKVEEIQTLPLGVTDAKAEAAADGALSVNLSWVNPSKNTAGNDLTTLDKIVISSGTTELKTLENTEAGAEMSETVEVDAAGEYAFTITAYVGENASESVEVKTSWVGSDTPKAPESVSVSIDENGARSIEFAPVTEGIHGGYINADALHYIIKRNDVELASDVIESPYVDEVIVDLGMFTYSVAAVDGELAGEFTAAEPVRLGEALSLPYEPDFSTASSFEFWNLGKWKYDKDKSNNPALRAGSSDIWMFTPQINMQAGTCAIHLKATCYSSRYTSDLAAYLMTTDNIADTVSSTKIGEIHIESVSWPDETVWDFEVPSDGKYYIAIGDVTPDTFYTYLSYFKVEQTNVTSGIEGVETEDVEGDALYFDLQGRPVAKPSAGQLLIKHANGRATKIRF